MKRLKLLVAFLTLVIDLLPTVAMAPGGDLSQLKQTGADKHESAPEHVQDSPRNQKDPSSQFETGLLETLRALIDQEKAAEEQRHADGESWDSPSVLIQGGMLGGSLVYAAVAIFQLVAIKRQARYMRRGLELTQESNKAAQVAAAAAKAALQRNRPYLLMTEVKGSATWGDNPDFVASIECMVRNFGQAPAIIKEVRACINPSYPFLSEPPDFGGCLKLDHTDITREIVPIGEDGEFTIWVSRGVISGYPEKDSPVHADVRGVIIYEEPTGDTFETHFGYRCYWTAPGGLDPASYWAFTKGPASYFKRT